MRRVSVTQRNERWRQAKAFHHPPRLKPGTTFTCIDGLPDDLHFLAPMWRARNHAGRRLRYKQVPVPNCPASAGPFLRRRRDSEMDEKEEAKEKLKRALQALNAPEKQMVEPEESFGLPTDKNLSLGQRLAWIKQRIGPRGRHFADSRTAAAAG